MTIDEIKDNIGLLSPFSTNLVPYDRNFVQTKQVLKTIDLTKYASWMANDSVTVLIFCYEFCVRQTGRTTNTVIEALHHLSEGRTVCLQCYNAKNVENVQRLLKTYAKQFGIIDIDKKCIFENMSNLASRINTPQQDVILSDDLITDMRVRGQILSKTFEIEPWLQSIDKRLLVICAQAFLSIGDEKSMMQVLEFLYNKELDNE